MGRRTILLVAALVVAALGTVLVFLYAQGANNRAQADNDPVTVLVATSTISTGTSASEAKKSGAIDTAEVPRSALVPGALTSTDGLSGQVALTPVYEGQQLLAQQFGATSSVSTSSLPIPKGKLAVSVQLADPARVAGFVQPGSSVAVFASMGSDQTRLLLSRVQVIAAGPTTLVSAAGDAAGDENTEELPKALLTLAVSQKEAQKVIYASQNGQLYFGLLTSTSAVAPASGTDDANLFD